MMPVLQTQRARVPQPRQDKFDSEEFARAQPSRSDPSVSSILASNFLVLSTRRQRMQALFERMQSLGDVLDVGAQYCPYDPLFKDKYKSYTSMDIVDTPMVDIVCSRRNFTSFTVNLWAEARK